MKRVVLLSIVVAAAANASDPYYYMDFKNFSDVNHPLQYYVDNRVGTPAGVDVNQVLSAAQDAWDQWNAVSCAIPKSQSMGFTTGVVPDPSNPYDVYNVNPVFITDQSDPYFGDIFDWDVSAVTLPTQYAGVLQTCDIYLNGTDKLWSTGDPVAWDHLDVETVVLHETGHCLGIDHQPNYPESIMQGDILPGQEQHTLSDTDVDILCQRYPLSGGIGSPCSGTSSCGSAIPGLQCVQQVIGGGAPISFCTVGCTLNSGVDCDTPLICQSSTAFTGFNGACLRPGTSTTQVGKACMMPTVQQDCGSSIAICQEPVGNYWQDGYCSERCAAGDPGCPSGSTCITLNFNATTEDVCLQTCRVGSADCRPGYACALAMGSTAADGVCIPRCLTDADCATGFTCRSCDGLCVLLNNPTTEIGDPCGLDTDCGSGQVCLALTNFSNERQCTLPCGTSCGGCPGGSTCQPVASAGDQMFCLRNCTGPFSCPNGQQCGNLPTGHACLPPCLHDIDCPVGLQCLSGTCGIATSGDDGGCVLCPSDGGVPIKPHPKDAGMGDGGGGGCGCTAVEAPWALLALLLRRRSWRQRRQ